MNEEPGADARTASEALALARAAGAPAARAARREQSHQLLATGAAMSVAVLGTGLTRLWDGAGIWIRALVIGALWAVLLATAINLAGRAAVRAAPRRGLTAAIGVTSVVMIAATMATGPEHFVAYPIGAAATFALWVLAAVRVRR
jgi:hypothetical protein